MGAGDRTVELAERLEDDGLLIGRNARTGIRDRELYAGGGLADAQRNRPGTGELRGIDDEVAENGPQLHRVRNQCRGRLREIDRKVDVFAIEQLVAETVELLAELDRLQPVLMHLEDPGASMRIVKKVLHQLMQVVRGVGHAVQRLHRIGWERAVIAV